MTRKRDEWYWVCRVNREWFPAKWDGRYFTNEDTWWDFHGEIVDWRHIRKPHRLKWWPV